MSDYTKTTDFAIKDGLATGNPAKVIKGTEHDTEYNNIATAIATKADKASPTFTGVPAAPNPTTGVRTTQIATMQKFADEFVSSQVSNGYTKLPNGLILQWGTDVGGSGGTLTYSFPIVFPTAAFCIVGIIQNVLASYTARADIVSTSQYKVGATNGAGLWSTDSIRWIAIGN